MYIVDSIQAETNVKYETNQFFFTQTWANQFVISMLENLNMSLIMVIHPVAVGTLDS